MKTNSERIFRHRLARELGMTVSRLLAEMDSREYVEWMAYFTIENEQHLEKRKEREQSEKKTVASKLQATMKGWGSGKKRSG